MSATTQEQMQAMAQEMGALKIRLFDTQEFAARTQAQLKDLNDALVSIARHLGMEGEEITVDAVVEAVKAAVPVEAEVEAE